MKHKVELIIFLLLGLTSLVYVFPFNVVHAAKLESGVTINQAPPTSQTGPCVDKNLDGFDDNTNEDCVAAPAGPAAGTCGLEFPLGAHLNYGQLNVGQDSAEKAVMITNLGNTTARVMVKGSDWMSDDGQSSMPAGNTHVAPANPDNPDIPWGNKEALDTTEIELGQLVPGQSGQAIFQFKSPVGISGIYQQEVTIDSICEGNEFLKEDETKGDYNTTAKTPNTQSPVPIPYPDTNNITGTQIRAD